jgi:hypothetical protein
MSTITSISSSFTCSTQFVREVKSLKDNDFYDINSIYRIYKKKLKKVDCFISVSRSGSESGLRHPINVGIRPDADP